MEAKLAFLGHALMENRCGLVVDACLTQANGHAERLAALAMIEKRADRPRALTLGADKGYDTSDFVNELRSMKVRPHVTRRLRGSAIDRRTTRHPGYRASQRIRKRGKCATMTHDYKRNGTTTLFATLDTIEGKVIARCVSRHRHQEFIGFLAKIERAVPAGKIIHAIADNYAAHKHPEVKAWLAEHPRWTLHFTPTSCSWLNAVEGFFSKLTRQSIRRGVFRSVDDLKRTIARYIANANKDPRPFVWTASAQSIRDKLAGKPTV